MLRLFEVDSDALYQRYSDDGEPRNGRTAHVDVIRKKNLQNVASSGYPLFWRNSPGAGGLVRAYSKACAGGLEDARGGFGKACLKL